MGQGSTFELRIYVTESIYTTLKHKAERLGLTMSSLVRAYIINELDKQNLENKGVIQNAI